MPKRNHSRRTSLQQRLDPLLDDFVTSWLDRSWLVVGETVDETKAMVKESFSHDLDRAVRFLSCVTDRRVSLSSLFTERNHALRLRTYQELGDIQDDIATLIQFPALLGSVDSSVEWAKTFRPVCFKNGNGRFSANYHHRISLIEIRSLAETGVPLEYVRALDPGPEFRYPVGPVLEAYHRGIAPEFATALLHAQ